MGAFLGGYARWDPDGIVVAACAFARDLLCPSEVDYDDFTLRVAVCACYTIAFKNGTDHSAPSQILYPNNSFLTTVYHALFFDLRSVSTTESQTLRLHDTIEHMEGQLLVRVWTRIYAHATLSATGRLENLIASLVMRGARPPPPPVGAPAVADDPIHINAAFFDVTQRVAGFLNALVLVSESCDAALTDLFHRADVGARVEEALLLICAYAITNAGVRCEIPVCVAAYMSTIDVASTDVAIQVAAMYLACRDRLTYSTVHTFATQSDADADRILRPCVLESVLGTLHRRHLRAGARV